ncbi:MAG TPA: PAS domain-containing protein [Longimicrobiales bacterium]|nr:PAS domain-containing protein [Longimicrobiales bacterium]
MAGVRNGQDLDLAEGGDADELLHICNALQTVTYLEVDEQGDVMFANGSMLNLLDLASPEVIDQQVSRFVTEPDAATISGWLAGDRPPDGPHYLNFVARGDSPRTLRCMILRLGTGLRIIGESDTGDNSTAAEELLRVNNEFATLTRELSRRSRELERTRGDLEAALEELRTSYWHLQKIQEVLPVCMGCGHVKGHETRWQSVVDYLRQNSIFVSHGYCPDCHERVMDEFGLQENP